MATKQSSIVIGILKHYTDQVKLYRFKDKTTGKIYKIFATPNHPFYVVNKKKFMAISTINRNDQLLSQSHKIMYLICEKNQMSGCGVKNSRLTSVLPVYNLEVAKYHTFFVSNAHILVHNCSTTQSNGLSFATALEEIKNTNFKEDIVLPTVQTLFAQNSKTELLNQFKNYSKFFEDRDGVLSFEFTDSETHPVIKGLTNSNDNRVGWEWYSKNASEIVQNPELFTEAVKLYDVGMTYSNSIATDIQADFYTPFVDHSDFSSMLEVFSQKFDFLNKQAYHEMMFGLIKNKLLF